MNSEEAVAKGLITTLKLEKDCRYIILADAKGVPRSVMEDVVRFLQERWKVHCVLLVTHGKPDDVVKVVEMKP
ncbi:hypothetical protein LCGC14_1293080 [marine sediment metagenome]|uniref:Uncharacterized protein n=1 Tax=marine sediment metagenome TaxID=412755 RepID=A0A0F9N8C9_9ZZZZ